MNLPHFEMQLGSMLHTYENLTNHQGQKCPKNLNSRLLWCKFTEHSAVVVLLIYEAFGMEKVPAAHAHVFFLLMD